MTEPAALNLFLPDDVTIFAVQQKNSTARASEQFLLVGSNAHIYNVVASARKIAAPLFGTIVGKDTFDFPLGCYVNHRSLGVYSEGDGTAIEALVKSVDPDCVTSGCIHSDGEAVETSEDIPFSLARSGSEELQEHCHLAGIKVLFMFQLERLTPHFPPINVAHYGISVTRPYKTHSLDHLDLLVRSHGGWRRAMRTFRHSW